MGIRIDDPETEAMIRELAKRLGVSRTQAIKIATIHQLELDNAEGETPTDPTGVS